MNDILTDVKIDFSEDNLLFLNFALAFIMFGVALGIKTENFRELARNPRSVVTGVLSQFLLLPALTYILVMIFDRSIDLVAGLGLGMILVAACPGGNLSNFFSSIGKGNVALSITLTAIATVLAMFLTPLNFEVWSSFYLGDRIGGVNVSMDSAKMMKMVFLLLVVPLIVGILFNTYLPRVTNKINLPIKVISFFILIGFIVVAFLKNLELFVQYYDYIIFVVFIHNLVALGSGYYFSKMLGNKSQDNRTISIETGIQNSGLGLVIIFSIFDGNGGMALITAWWGIWHIIAGIAIALFYSRGAIFQTQKV
jgi:BASS family bile acid:Na+ symporter